MQFRQFNSIPEDSQSTILDNLKPYYQTKIMTHMQYKTFIRLHATYFINRASVVSGVVMSQKLDNVTGRITPHVLFVQDQKGCYQLPGGRIDPRGMGRQNDCDRDESPVEALVGELQEETQATIENISVSRPYKEKMLVGNENNQIKTMIYVYAFEVDPDDVAEGHFQSQFETCGTYWVPIDHISDSKKIPSRYKLTIYKMIKNIIKQNTSVYVERVNKENIVELCKEVLRYIPKNKMHTTLPRRRVTDDTSAPIPESH